MKLYVMTKPMTFEEEGNLVEHEVVLGISDEEFMGYDHMIELPDDDKFIKNNLKIYYKKDKNGKETKEIDYKVFKVREDKTWWSFPLYEWKDGKIVDFDYTKYAYFQNTKRRNVLAFKVKELYNPSSEYKTLRKTLKYIMDTLGIEYPDFFKKYNSKIEAVIRKNPKENRNNGRIS